MHLRRRDRRSRTFAFHQSRLTIAPEHLRSLLAKDNKPTILLRHDHYPGFRTDRSYTKKKKQTHQLATTKAPLNPPFLSQGTRCWEDKIHLDKKFPYRDYARSDPSLNRADFLSMTALIYLPQRCVF